MFFLDVYFSPSTSLFNKILPSLLSVSVAILLFIIGRYIDSKIRKSAISRDWYMKVIIDPNIDQLDKFISDCCTSLKKSIQILSASRSSSSFNVYIESKAKEIGSFQVIKRSFELNFISIIKTTCPSIASDISDLIIELEDDITTILDVDNLSIDYYDEIVDSFARFKPMFLDILYKPLAVAKL